MNSQWGAQLIAVTFGFAVKNTFPLHQVRLSVAGVELSAARVHLSIALCAFPPH
jgi:hypothetical protein